MATASYRFYVGAIAERPGFDDVIATEAEIDETGRLYAKMVGANVSGPAKLDATEAWLAREGIDRGDCHKHGREAVWASVCTFVLISAVTGPLTTHTAHTI